MTGILAWEAALARASAVWEAEAAELRGAVTTLDGVDTSLLGPRVGGEADAFFAHWLGCVQGLQADADAHASALGEVFGRLQVPDAATACALHGLLPYGERDDVPDALW